VRYRLIAVGKLTRGFAAEGCRHYRQRLERLATVEWSEIREARGEAEAVRRREGEALLAAAAGHLVALDERGRTLGSRALAGHLTALELRGVSRVSLLIGGAEGLSPEVRERADELWTLSGFTLPHELARLLLLEQLYRAETIRAGHPYHREG
jgi:23S rRNA (pseudouridine1915-N3)-methyltransferase